MYSHVFGFSGVFFRRKTNVNNGYFSNVANSVEAMAGEFWLVEFELTNWRVGVRIILVCVE